jgi:hypothetical protein
MYQLNDDTPSLHFHYRNFITTTSISAPVHCISTFGLAFLWLVPFRLPSVPRFLRSTPKPVLCSCRLHAGCQADGFRIYLCFYPYRVVEDRFLHHFALSTPRQRFTCVHLHRTHMPILLWTFPSSLTTIAFDYSRRLFDRSA